jgi:hypothetical protein
VVLGIELPVRFRYSLWREHGVILAFGGYLAQPGRVDLAVYDYVRDVHSLRPELPRHRLGQRPEPELADREGRETGRAPQGRRRAGQEDGTSRGLDHRGQYLLRRVEGPGILYTIHK